MLCGFRFTREFNIRELNTGKLVCSRDPQVINGISWNIGVRRSVSSIDTLEKEHVIRTANEILGMPLSIPESRTKSAIDLRLPEYIETDFQTGCKHKASVRKVHFDQLKDDVTENGTGYHEAKEIYSNGSRRIVSKYGSYHAKSDSDSDNDVRNRRERMSANQTRFRTEDVESSDSEYNAKSYRVNKRPPIRPISRYGHHSDSPDSDDRWNRESRDHNRNTSSSESEGEKRQKLKYPVFKKTQRKSIETSDTSDSEDEDLKQNGRYSYPRSSVKGRHSKYNEPQLTSLDFYLIFNEKGNEHLKQCGINFTLDIVNKKRGLKKVRKYKYQTFFPGDVSGWTNVIQWKHLNNLDNGFVDKSGWFKIEVALIIMNMKLLLSDVIPDVIPEKLETIV